MTTSSCQVISYLIAVPRIKSQLLALNQATRMPPLSP
jgi:hypothetical protein